MDAELERLNNLPTPYYDRDGITIYCGDCREILPLLPKVDLVLTDPPYGINAANVASRANKRHGKAMTESRDYGEIKWDDAPPPAWLIEQCVDKAEASIIWGGNYFHLPPSSCWLVWDKDNGANDYADCELAWTNLDKAVRKIVYRWQGMLQQHGGDKKEPRWHPTQKPLAVMKWALAQAPDESETVLDPFMGVGTTLRAALDLGKRCVGIEREEKYCAIAVERLRQGVLL